MRGACVACFGTGFVGETPAQEPKSDPHTTFLPEHDTETCPKCSSGVEIPEPTEGAIPKPEWFGDLHPIHAHAAPCVDAERDEGAAQAWYHTVQAIRRAYHAERKNAELERALQEERELANAGAGVVDKAAKKIVGLERENEELRGAAKAFIAAVCEGPDHAVGVPLDALEKLLEGS